MLSTYLKFAAQVFSCELLTQDEHFKKMLICLLHFPVLRVKILLSGSWHWKLLLVVSSKRRCYNTLTE
jgi:hypothetical protein